MIVLPTCPGSARPLSNSLDRCRSRLLRRGLAGACGLDRRPPSATGPRCYKSPRPRAPRQWGRRDCRRVATSPGRFARHHWRGYPSRDPQWSCRGRAASCDRQPRTRGSARSPRPDRSQRSPAGRRLESIRRRGRCTSRPHPDARKRRRCAGPPPWWSGCRVRGTLRSDRRGGT